MPLLTKVKNRKHPAMERVADSFVVHRFPKLRISAMQHYRTYFLDENGHISNAIDMECTDDEQARECAKKFVSGLDAELWHEDRLIATYNRVSLLR
jgi:hypothetical protein